MCTEAGFETPRAMIKSKTLTFHPFEDFAWDLDDSNSMSDFNCWMGQLRQNKTGQSYEQKGISPFFSF